MGKPQTIAPRMLKKEQAAEYCGLAVPTFDRICPVAATRMSNDARTVRYDVRLLDIWLDSFRSDDVVTDDDLWIDKMRRGAKHASA